MKNPANTCGIRAIASRFFNLVLPENSDSWNCLSEVEGQELMAQLFVDVIIKNTNSTGKGDHFWDSCEMNLLKALVLYVDQSYAKRKQEYRRGVPAADAERGIRLG